MKMPTPVEITPALMKQLREAEEGKRSVEMLIHMFAEQTEKRISAINSQVQQTWVNIGNQYGIDLENIMWVPHPTENKIMPAQIKIVEEAADIVK